jgi:hypothetical protein
MLQKEQQHEHGSAMAEEKNHRSSSGIGRPQFSLAAQSDSITLFEIFRIALFSWGQRAVAQLGRAPGSGPGGRGFKSHQPD